MKKLFLLFLVPRFAFAQLTGGGLSLGIDPSLLQIPFPLTGIDSGNSSTASLAANATFTGAWKDVSLYSNVTVTVISDQLSATNGLVIEYSHNASTVDDNDTYTFGIVSNGQQFSFALPLQYYRVRYINGATLQTSFMLQSKLHVSEPKPSSHRIGDPVIAESDAVLVKSNTGAFNGTNLNNVTGTTISSVFGMDVAAQGNVASGSTDSGNPVKVGAVANTTYPILSNGQRVDLQADVLGGLLTSAGARYKNISTNATTTVKSGTGYLFSICSNNVINNASLTVYDNTAGSGTIIGTLTQQLQGSLLSGFAMWTPTCQEMMGAEFNTGLTVVSTGGSNWTVYYK